MFWHGWCCAAALLSAHGGDARLGRAPPRLPGHTQLLARARRPAMVEGTPLTPPESAMVQLDVSDAAEEPAPMMPVVDGVSIIAGTAIGGGFLALPSVTAPMGVGPAVVLMLLVWAFLAITGIAYAEAASMSLEGGSENLGDATGAVSVASITERTFGERAAYACSLAFAAQMLAVVTAQVSSSTPPPWPAARSHTRCDCRRPSPLPSAGSPNQACCMPA
jgi:tyrosine-specific transport protein